MLKDYFNSDLSAKNQQRIANALEKCPRHLVFTSYGQARGYRSANCAKNDNGRYDDVIFLYDGFYYVVDKMSFHRFKLFIATVADDDRFDKEIEYCLNNVHPYTPSNRADVDIPVY